MRPAKAETRQHLIGIADEIAVSEKQQFDHIPFRFGAAIRRSRMRASGGVREAEFQRAACSRQPY